MNSSLRAAVVSVIRHAALAAGFSFSVFAASAPVAPATDAAQGEAVVLSPFEVSAASQTGYMASTSLSATRTNEKLENLPNSISVFTPDLLKDLNATSMFDAVEYAVGAS